jgi:tetratricopeptide (TPR) repeat protein
VGDLLTFKLGPRRRMRCGTSATAWYERGVAAEASDQQVAMAAYRRALAALPHLADAHNNLGRLHHDRGELAVAESCYRLAICAEAGVALYWFNLGVALEDQARNAEAIAAYAQALAVDPTCADAHFNLARLHELHGRRAGDVLEIQRAVRHLASYRALMKRLA